ncbi:aspartic proteinase-like protein 2 [Cucurbita moschata]|uniref:Aspartic proteinase-like protein 2 n=1 Tax=Cucurbita moschata TaxID=3662 RepID=A0A6J1FYJ9_CUCMO|nr:aspartic proteinase-like protein 2 [Cucurbita moschata]
MAAIVRIGALVAVAVVLIHAATVSYGFSAKLTLERAFPTNHGVEMVHLRGRDRARHGRMLQSSGGVIDFLLSGTYEPYYLGLYYTKVQLGNPPKDFYVQIDTGSNILWVCCNSCIGCSETGALQVELNVFDPGNSSTASLVSCSDKICTPGVVSSDSSCFGQTNQCAFALQYGDGSETSGYFVIDKMRLNVVGNGHDTSNPSASVVFGCSTSQTGDLTKSDKTVDGIFGFGQRDLSVISQLSSRGLAPKVFSHCLNGDDSGGGILVLGEILDPNVVYTPLVPSQSHYNLNLQSISVNGQVLPINPALFATASGQGAIIDSGTTLAYLAEEAYDIFIVAITNTISKSTQSFNFKGNQCYLTSSSISDIFPQASFNFAGGASLLLRPQDYLIQQFIGDNVVWCVGFQKIQGQGATILGDLVLKDKIFVYDLANQQIGWTNFNCAMSINVSTTTRTSKSGLKAQVSDGGSVGNQPDRLVLHLSILVFFVHLSIFTSFLNS